MWGGVLSSAEVTAPSLMKAALSLLTLCAAQLTPDALLGGCGDPCARAGAGALLDDSLFVSPPAPALDTDGRPAFNVVWGSRQSSSILQTPGYTVSGKVLAVLSADGVAHTVALGALQAAGVAAWPAEQGNLLLSAAWEAELEATFPNGACPDNLILAMTIADA